MISCEKLFCIWFDRFIVGLLLFCFDYCTFIPPLTTVIWDLSGETVFLFRDNLFKVFYPFLDCSFFGDFGDYWFSCFLSLLSAGCWCCDWSSSSSLSSMWELAPLRTPISSFFGAGLEILSSSFSLIVTPWVLLVPAPETDDYWLLTSGFKAILLWMVLRWGLLLLDSEFSRPVDCD